MYIFYYSYGGTTKRLVNRIAREIPRARVVQIVSSRPHSESYGLDPYVLQDDLLGHDVVLVVPTYGRFVPAKGETADYLPTSVRNFLRWLGRDDVHVIVTGNRTFGSKVFAAELELPPGAKVVHRVELDGTRSDAKAIADKLHYLS